MDSPPRSDSAWKEVYEIVRQIPPGRVMSYGQIAGLLQRPLTARAVGWAMHACPPGVPWQRVVSARGECSADRGSSPARRRQRTLLQAEGVTFTLAGQVDMARHALDTEPRETGRPSRS